MIELRWLNQRTQRGEWGYITPLLQLRQKLSTHLGIYDEWSEWIDVPYVEEEKDE